MGRCKRLLRQKRYYVGVQEKDNEREFRVITRCFGDMNSAKRRVVSMNNNYMGVKEEECG